MAITKIQLRRDYPNNWVANNPVLSSGEIGIETPLENDTTGQISRIKIGDGVTKVSDLDYLVSPVGLSGSYKDLTNKPNIDFIKCLMDPTHYTNEVRHAYQSFIHLTKEEPGGIALI